jgi:high affinity Mn2+ porin
MAAIPGAARGSLRAHALTLFAALAGLGAAPPGFAGTPGVVESAGIAEASSLADLPALPAPERPAPTDAAPPADAPPERFSVHYQATVATQAHPSFSARYTGANSLVPDAESATSVVTDLFLGARLPWPGAEVYVQPELSGGRGLSKTLGVAAFPSGEVYRVGEFTPSIQVARVFLRQVFGLGGGTVAIEAGPNQLAGKRDRDALTLTVGKLAVPDFVDNNPVSNDPHTRFMSWALFASGAYDYPADTRGYTWGAAAALDLGRWSGRAGVVLEPQYANLLALEWNVSKARGLFAEVEARFAIAGRPGAVRLLGFLNDARMGSYAQALEPAYGNDVTATRAFGRTKAGFAASFNQDLGAGLAAFGRVSYNDGQNETWAFTEIDQSIAGGVVQSGARWGREGDEAGLALVVSGISALHRRYLASGGYGFIIGDGALRYGPEILGELFYRAALTREVSAGVNYQPIVNPAFNRDRGPAHVFTARVHVAF